MSPRSAEYVAAVSGPTYRSAFEKLMQLFGEQMLTREEAMALTSVRALNYNTSGDGGYGVPLGLDPSIILTNAGVNNPIRRIARQVTIDTQKWQGIASTGSTASWDAELVEVSDDSPTLTQPAIETEKLSVWVPFSIEVSQDYPMFAAEVRRVMFDAIDRAEATAFVTGAGAGSAEPTGIVTELDGGSYENTSPDTAESFTVEDVWATAEAPPERFWSDPSCAWLAHRGTSFKIRQFADGASQSAGAFWAELAEGNPPRLLGKPIHDSSVLPSAGGIDAAATAANTGILLVGAWESSVVVDRIGVSVIPSGLTLGSNRRPDGGMGFYCYKRVGAGSVNDSPSTCCPSQQRLSPSCSMAGGPNSLELRLSVPHHAATHGWHTRSRAQGHARVFNHGPSRRPRHRPQSNPIRGTAQQTNAGRHSSMNTSMK